MSGNTRRKFLKTTTITSLAIGAMGIAGCGSGNSRMQSKKSAKSEILYNGNTKYWREYYSTAK